MSIWTTVNNIFFKRTSTFFLTVAGGSFFFERILEVASVQIFEHVNKGKIWKDVKARLDAGPPAEEAE